jgi:hypothetical protein
VPSPVKVSGKQGLPIVRFRCYARRMLGHTRETRVATPIGPASSFVKATEDKSETTLHGLRHLRPSAVRLSFFIRVHSRLVCLVSYGVWPGMIWQMAVFTVESV